MMTDLYKALRSVNGSLIKVLIGHKTQDGEKKLTN